MSPGPASLPARRVARKVARRAACLGLAALAAACGGRRTTRETAAGTLARAEREAVVSLRVQNRNFNDVVIWLERPGNRSRVGTVSGSSEGSFALPARLWDTPEGIRLAAETVGQRSARADGSASLGDRRVVTERLALTAGRRVTWTLESALQRSHVGVQ